MRGTEEVRADLKGLKGIVPVLAMVMLLAVLPLTAAGGGTGAWAGSPPRVVLTFDDGYNLDHRIIDYLNSQGIQATAFVIGSWAQRNPSLVQEMNSLGWDVCNHTQNHPWLTKIPDAQILAELNTCQAVIASITGQYNPVFRPPGGYIDARVTAVAASAGYAPVMWNFDSMDSSNTSIPVQDRVNFMVGSASDGNIILFHFGGHSTYELVTGVVQGLQQRGFCFVTLSELLGWKDRIRGGDSGPGVSEAALRQYFAEGTTRPGFEEWLLVFNPENKPATVRADYYSAQGVVNKEYTVPPHERLSIAVNSEVPWSDDVSLVLESSVPVAAERMLYFDRGWGFSGGSLAKGISEPSRRHYFPEGTVRPGFEEYLALFNPSAIMSAGAEVELTGAGGETTKANLEIPPLSRATVLVNELVQGEDYSMVVRSTIPVVAERSEYFVYSEIITGSHSSPGASMPQSEWFFAEGTTRSFFRSYLTIYNPCAYDSWLELQMIYSDGSLRVEQFSLAAGERKTIFLNSYLPAEIDYSLSVSSLLPIVAERITYFQTQNVTGGFCSSGVPAPRERWLFPEGCTSPGFSEWLAIFNPGEEDEVVEVKYIRGDGEVIERSYFLHAQERITVDVSAEVGQAVEVSMEVDCEAGVVAERSVYFNRPAF